jgi:hypothetical protein
MLDRVETRLTPSGPADWMVLPPPSTLDAPELPPITTIDLTKPELPPEAVVIDVWFLDPIYLLPPVAPGPGGTTAPSTGPVVKTTEVSILD